MSTIKKQKSSNPSKKKILVSKKKTSTKQLKSTSKKSVKKSLPVAKDSTVSEIITANKPQIITLPENLSQEQIDLYIDILAEKELKLKKKIEEENRGRHDDEVDAARFIKDMVNNIKDSTSGKSSVIYLNIDGVPSKDKNNITYNPDTKQIVYATANTEKKIPITMNQPFIGDNAFNGIDEQNREFSIMKHLNTGELEKRKRKFLEIMNDVKDYNISWSPYLTHDNKYLIGVVSSQIYFRKSLVKSRKFWAKTFKEISKIDGVKVTGFVDMFPTDLAFCHIICYDPGIFQQLDIIVGEALKKENDEYIEMLSSDNTEMAF